jgi:hypothetical protein
MSQEKLKSSSSRAKNRNAEVTTKREDLIKQIDKLRTNVKQESKVSKPATTQRSYLYAGAGVILAVIAFAVIFANPFGNLGTTLGGGNGTIATYTTACVNNLPVDIHFHATLELFVNDSKITIPANIGISETCHRPLHTHDTSGLIHIESSTRLRLPAPTLGDFFDSWGQPLTSSQVWIYAGLVEMLVNGASYAESFRSLLLSDQQLIVLKVTQS